MELRRPALTDKESILEMMTEFTEHQSPHDGGFWKDSNFDYQEWLDNNLDNESGLNLPDGWVPAIQLVAFQDNKALGFLSLRLRLNDYLMNIGGHIGYSVRPTERGKGYAKEMLKQGLALAKTKNISEVLVTCDEYNLASRTVILANNGQLENIRDSIEQYWIKL